jgi:hypothetical protein
MAGRQQHDRSARRPDDGEPGTKRDVLAQLVREDCPQQWRASELVDELPGLHSPAAVHRAVRELVEVGVAYRSGPFVWVTAGTRYLRSLGVIAPKAADEPSEAPREAAE